jgi:hypothetical protein
VGRKSRLGASQSARLLWPSIYTNALFLAKSSYENTKIFVGLGSTAFGDNLLYSIEIDAILRGAGVRALGWFMSFPSTKGLTQETS